MSTSDAPNLRRLARQLADYGRRLRHLETVPQLSNSSLDDHGMPVYDADGNLSVTLGKQSDGTYSARPVRGPIPPAPAGLDAEGDAGLVHASWQGVFWAGAAFPRDFEAVEVLVDGNVHGAIHDPDGGSVTVPAFAGERVVSFRTLSQAGRRSDATGHVTVTVQSKASVQLDEARGRIEDAEVSLGETRVRLDQAEQTVASTAEDLTRVETEVIPGAVAELEAADLSNAQSIEDAEARADQARTDLAAQIDQDIADAATALGSDIDSVRSSVDGKNAITQSVDAPPAQYAGAVGDRWERMSSMGSGGRLISNWRWNGTVWVSTIISDAVLGNVDAAKIGTGFLDAARLKAGSIQASSIAVGDFSNLATIDPVRGVNVTRPQGWSTITEGDWTRVPASSSDVFMFKDRTDTVPFGPSDRLRINFLSKSDAPVRAQFRLWAYQQAADGSTSGQRQLTSGYFDLPVAETRHSVTVDIPPDFGAGTIYKSWIIGLAPTSSTTVRDLYIRDATVYRMTGATLLQDGAITTDKVAANAISAGKIASGAVETQHLKAGAVTTDKLLAGAVTAEKITVTEALSANIVDAMSLNSKKLVVTEEAILNHATLIGDTVVDNINVTGKLIGTDGVFTGTVDFENVNVTGTQIVNKLGANSISADKIEGGHFTGETFEGGSFVGGEFRTSDNLPGQVRLADDAYVTHFDGGGVFPGMRITPADASGFSHLPAIGPGDQGLTIYGGRGTGGGSSIVQCNPTESLMRTFRDDSTVGGVIQTSPTASLMRTYREDGGIGGSIQTSPAKAFMQTYGDPAVGRSYAQVDPQKATMNVVGANGGNNARITADGTSVTLFSATNGQRYLKLNETGIWIETGGKSYNLEETAQDSGWQSFPVRSGITASGTAWRNKNGIAFFKGEITSNWTKGWHTIVSGLGNAPEFETRAYGSGGFEAPNWTLRMTAGGLLSLYAPEAGTQTIGLSPLVYPIG